MIGKLDQSEEDLQLKDELVIVRSMAGVLSPYTLMNEPSLRE